MEFRGQTVSDVWIPALRYILDEGIKRHTMHNNADFIEVTEPIIAMIKNPQKGRIPNGFDWAERTLKIYADMVLDKDDHGFVYTYGSRLGRGDQLDHVIRKLEEDPSTKQAVAITWISEKDNENNTPPCLQIVDFKIYHNKLQLVAYFRSNDYYAAFPANAYLLTELMHYISIRALGHSNLGPLTIISNAAHVYSYAINDVRRIIYGDQARYN